MSDHPEPVGERREDGPREPRTRGVDLRQSLERRSRAYHVAVHVKFPGLWEECPLSECFWDVSAIKMASTAPASTETNCPLEGVHEHVFRGPHRFREWEPA